MKRAMAVAAALLVAGAGSVVTGTAAKASTTPVWSRVFQSGTTGLFQSIDPISKSNIWAAATLFSGNNTIYKPYVVRYNGSRWNTVTIPGTTGVSTTTVQSTSASDVWVFGTTANRQNIAAYTAFHWNGATWRRISVPALTDLEGTVVLGPSNVWAFGGSGTMPGDIFHWNGSSWKAYDTTYSFNFLPESISASSSSNVWIAGIRYINSSTTVAIAFRWNGSRWSQASTPHPIVHGGAFVTVLSSSNVWMGCDTEPTASAEHWNGYTWTKITSPSNVETNAAEIVPDGRGGMWWGPFADRIGSTWINTINVSPSFVSGGFGPVAAIPGTSSSVMAAGVENTGSPVEHPTIYRLTFG